MTETIERLFDGVRAACATAIHVIAVAAGVFMGLGLSVGIADGPGAARAAPTAANPALLSVKRTRAYGGEGGGPFEISCPVGTVMTGLNARHGEWIDAVSPICSKFVQGNRFGEIKYEVYSGGNGGGRGYMRCQGPRGVVTGLQLFQANNRDGSVGHIIIECGDYRDPAKFNNKLPGSADYLGQSMRGQRAYRRCTPPMVAGGIYGRSGAFVDRLGLSCVDYQPRR
jgi:hypothetical protein